MQSRAAGDAPRAAIYCRLSEEDADKADPGQDSRSIQNQKSLLVKYAVEKGWDIYNIFCDEDYSGVDRERPAFQQLIADAQQGKFNIILVKTQSRFTRDMELVEKYIDHTRYDRLFYLMPDVCWVADGQRLNGDEDRRRILNDRLLQMYRDYGFGDKITIISGDYNARLHKAIQLVDDLLTGVRP